MYICDLCKKEVETKFDLYLLVEYLQTHDVKDVCGECHTELQEYLDRIDNCLTKVYAEKKENWFKKIVQRLLENKQEKNNKESNEKIY